ncbi:MULTISPECIES: (2Fe-2S) ferredoxin domain-containing protein [Syntrophotalea]|uniref:NADH dehydrogenase n=2 Tax=Syntrophotalea TaxID=2812025 RepID=A0A1L3GHK9_SYNAC|nr:MULTISPECIES: (2Fe-2S) ferredoxin domain-containing protein [Syntrophotalea]APG25424.1 NADH dehydrogenase [Syntrophotalea acetylenica]APG26407.1 NADH dehydrogenase [Syntrophotalea acetylenivorans]APG43492.1 NADH dehydrogenase [Syntrophotalea acetylenica]
MEHRIKICMGSSCYSRGNQENLERIERYLNYRQVNCAIDLRGSRCEGRCFEGPNIEINGRLFGGVKAETIEQLLDQQLGLY